MGSEILFTHVDARNGVAKVAVEGELDLASAPQLGEVFQLISQNGVSGVLLDLQALTFIDSTGLRSVVLAHDEVRATGKGFAILGVSAQARRVFEISGMSSSLLDQPEGMALMARYAPEVNGPVDESHPHV